MSSTLHPSVPTTLTHCGSLRVNRCKISKEFKVGNGGYFRKHCNDICLLSRQVINFDSMPLNWEQNSSRAELKINTNKIKIYSLTNCCTLTTAPTLLSSDVLTALNPLMLFYSKSANAIITFMAKYDLRTNKTKFS